MLETKVYRVPVISLGSGGKFTIKPSLQQMCKVFHVQNTKPIDLTDFWTSETMVVGVQSYSEDPKLGKIETEETKAIERGCKLFNNW